MVSQSLHFGRRPSHLIFLARHGVHVLHVELPLCVERQSFGLLLDALTALGMAALADAGRKSVSDSCQVGTVTSRATEIPETIKFWLDYRLQGEQTRVRMSGGAAKVSPQAD